VSALRDYLVRQTLLSGKEASMAHDSRCGGAKRAGCRCAGCAGTLHGWSGALGHTGASGRRRISSYGGVSYRSSSQGSLSSRNVAPDARKTAIANNIKKEIWLWLRTGSGDPRHFVAADTNEILSQISDGVAAAVLKGLDAEARASGQSENWQRSKEGHFLCSLFAEFARELSSVENLINESLDRLVPVMTDAIAPYAFMPKVLVKLAVQVFLDRMATVLFEVTHFNSFKRAVMMAGVLSCPDPVNHDIVREWCCLPLSKEVLSDEIKQELMGELPPYLRAGG
jgi:hypothetical protein